MTDRVCVDFGCDNIHSSPICCEQAGTVSNCYKTSCTTTTRSFLGGGWGGGLVGLGGPGHYVVTPTRVKVELGCDNKRISDILILF